MEVASDASAWLVAITTTLVRELRSLAHKIAQKRNLGVWEGCGERRRHSIVRLLFVTDSRIFCPLREL